MNKLIKYAVIFCAATIITFILTYKSIKITAIQNGLVTIDVLGLKFNYYYESEE